jgi:hypothetical protein
MRHAAAITAGASGSACSTRVTLMRRPIFSWLPRFASLATREADIVVTLDPPQHGRYIASRLTDFTYGTELRNAGGFAERNANAKTTGTRV